jgi:hypothetical protein
MHAPPTLFVMALALASAGCHDRNLAPEASHREAPSMTLSDDLERELRAIRADPIDAVGLGDTGYLPYVLRRGEPLTHSDEPAVTARLASAIADRSAPPTERLALLQVLGLRGDPSVDGALIDALADPALRPLAAYLLGRAGFKGYPRRARSTRAALAGLAAQLDDGGEFHDPWHDQSLHTQDLVVAAFIRIAGPERFDLSALDRPRAEMIGYELAALDPASRSSLVAQCKAVDVSTYH